MPTIKLDDDELAAVIAVLRRVIEEDRFPRAPGLDPVRAALGRLEAAANSEPVQNPSPLPKAPAGKVDKQSRR